MLYLGLEFEPLNNTILTEKDFSEFEEKYKIHIPEELKGLYRLTNESILDYPIIDCPGFDGGVMPEGWRGIGKYGMDYLIEFYGESLGENMLPFACDPGSNIFAVKMHGQEQVGVFYLDLDNLVQNSQCQYYSAHKLADNMVQFFESIKRYFDSRTAGLPG